jgi:hypothetical protein
VSPPGLSSSSRGGEVLVFEDEFDTLDLDVSHIIRARVIQAST